MSASRQQLCEEINRLKNSRYSLEGYFQDLFKQLLPTELLKNERMTVIDKLINQSTLPEVVKKKYEQEGYVLLFYSHKTHSDLISPYTGDKNSAHTSILLCKISEGKINHVLNIDGYHHLNYIDIIGEREGATPNPYIKNRIVIEAPNEDDPNISFPLQSASWENLNCHLYAIAFVKAILNAFEMTPGIFDQIFSSGLNTINPALIDLKNIIIQGVQGTYVKQQVNADGQIIFFRDPQTGRRFHDDVRQALARIVEERYEAQQEHKEEVENLTIKPVLLEPAKSIYTNMCSVNHEKQPVRSVAPVSIFKQPEADLSMVISELMRLCMEYQVYLNEEIKKRPYLTHGIFNSPSDNKYSIVNRMIEALKNDCEPNEFNRIYGMKQVLTTENKGFLAEHRSICGKLLQMVLDLLSSTFGQTWRYKAKGEELTNQIENVLNRSQNLHSRGNIFSG